MRDGFVMDRGIKYAFLGGIFPKELINEIKKKSVGSIQYASDALQWNLVNGIDKNIGSPIKILNRMFIGSFPNKYKDFYIKPIFFNHTEGAQDINMGFLNILFFRQLLIPKVPNKYLSQWIKSNQEFKKVIFVYSTNFIQNISFIKNIDSSVHVCLILPDLPLFMNMDKSNSIIFKYLNAFNQEALIKNINNIDSFVLLTDQMADAIGIRDIKPYVVVEGMVSDSYIESNIIQKETKTICYTGTLTKKYGVMDLVKAFQMIDDNEYKLIICGSGEAELDIRKIALENSRIEYKGIVTREEAMRIQMSSTILVNPRKNDEAYTKYSFPSKTVEYMLSGRPIVCYKLDGIPNEYDDYLNYVTDNSIESLKNKLIEVLSIEPKQLTKQGVKK